MSEVITKELPKGWQKCKFGDVMRLRNGYAFKSKDYSECGIPLVRISDLKEGEVSLDKAVFIPDDLVNEGFLVEHGDLLIAMSGATTGKIGIYKGVNPVLQNQRVGNFKIIDETVVDKKYRDYFVLSLRKYIEGAAYGGAQPNISAKDIEGFEFPLAPPEQQKRIVAKIEELFSHIDAGIEALKKAKQLLKQYRQSVLKAAVTGELTKEWRKENKNKLEPASKLLDRILKERRERWEEKQLKQFKVKGKVPKHDKWKEKYKTPDVDEVAKLVELPEGWLWVATELLAKGKDNSLGAGPFGTIFKKKDFRESGVPIIFLRHVKAGKYLTKKPTYMDLSKWDELFVPYSVFGGEILMTKLGDPPGEAAIYPEGIGPAMVTPDVIKLDVNNSIANPEFVMNFYNSEISTSFITKLAFGTTRLRVTLPIFKALPVPIPPLEEQREIVRLVTEKNDVAKRLEDEIGTQLIKAEKNKQSILASAFSGQLIKNERLVKIFPFPDTVDGISQTDVHAGVIALAIRAHECSDKAANTLGHVKCEKISHLVESYIGISLGRSPYKDAAGPNDYRHLHKVDSRGKKANWFEAKKLSDGRHKYVAKLGMASLVARVTEKLGEKTKAIDNLISLFVPMKTEQAEIVATLYSGWNNLLIEGLDPSDEEIVYESRENWHEAKLKIDRARFFKALTWMRDNNLVPRGQGGKVNKK